MSKKITALLLCILLVLPIQCLNIYAQDGFYDDFSTIRKGGRLDGTKWQLTNKDYMTIDMDPTGTRHALKFGNESGGAGEGADTRFQTAAAALYTEFKGTITVEESFFIPEKLDKSLQLYTHFYTNECSASDNTTLSPFFYLKDGKVTTAGGAVLQVEYPVGEWFTVKIVIHSEDMTFDIMIETQDGNVTLWGEMLSIPENWASLYKEWGLRRIRTGFIFGDDDAQVYIGGVKIYKGLPKKGANKIAVIAFPDGTEGSVYEKDIQLLSSLGVITESTVNPDEVITRAKALEFVFKLSGILPYNSYDADFTDVTEEHPQSGYISTAVKMGIVNSGDLFYPDESVTGNQMLTMLLNSAGYKLIAQSRGTWPGGYIRVANDYDMLDGISYNMNDALTLGQMAQLSKGFLKLHFAEETISENKMSVSYGTDNSIAYAVFGINSAKGIVETTASKSIYGYPSDEGRIKIDGYDLRNRYSGIENYFGQYVEYWYDDDGVLYYAYPYGQRNNTLTVKSNYFSLNDKGNICYEDMDKKTQTISVSDNAAILYNGIRLSNPAASDFAGADAVELISNDTDNTYDIVNIIKTTVHITGGVSAKENFFYDRNGDVSINLENKKSVKVFKDGEEVRLTAIKEGTVVSVGTERLPYGSSTDNAQYITFYVSDKKISGKVNAIGEDEIQIGEESYIVSNNNPNVKLGDWGVFWLDHLGRIAYFVPEGEVGGTYGIILDCALNTKRFAEYAEFLILNTNEEEEVFKTGEEVILNDKKVTPAEAISALSGAVMNEVIRYDMDMYGNLYSITTATDYSGELPYTPYHPDEFSLDYNGKPKIHLQHTDVITGSILANDETIVFVKYNDGGNLKFKIIPGDSIEISEADEGKSYHRPANMKVYDTNAERIAKIVLVRSDKIVTSLESTVTKSVPMAVTKALVMSEDDSVVISGIQGNSDLTINCEVDEVEILAGTKWEDNLTYQGREINSVKDIKKGDIIQYYYGVGGKVTCIHVLYNSSIPYSEYKNNYPVLPDNNQYRSTSTHTGEALIYRDGFLTLDASPDRSWYIPSTTPVVIIRQGGKYVENATISDICAGDKIMIFARYLNVRTVFVFKD